MILFYFLDQFLFLCRSLKTKMTFTMKCYQNNFLINNLNILSFGGEIRQRTEHYENKIFN